MQQERQDEQHEDVRQEVQVRRGVFPQQQKKSVENKFPTARRNGQPQEQQFISYIEILG